MDFLHSLSLSLSLSLTPTHTHRPSSRKDTMDSLHFLCFSVFLCLSLSLSLSLTHTHTHTRTHTHIEKIRFYQSTLLVCPLHDIQCRHRDNESKSLLVSQYHYFHVKLSKKERWLWVLRCFFCKVQHVLFVLFVMLFIWKNKWPISYSSMECYFWNFFKNSPQPPSFWTKWFSKVPEVQSYRSTDMDTAWKKPKLILSKKSVFHIIYNFFSSSPCLPSIYVDIPFP